MHPEELAKAMSFREIRLAFERTTDTHFVVNYITLESACIGYIYWYTLNCGTIDCVALLAQMNGNRRCQWNMYVAVIILILTTESPCPVIL